MRNKKILLVFVVAFLTLLVGCLPAPPNQAPVITSTPVTTAEVGVPYTYDVDATDPDVGDTLTYTLVSKPTNMSISSTTGLINWIPAVPGTFNVIVKVSDGDLDITQSFKITVVEEEEPSPSPTPTPPKKYTITATAGSNGAINPSGAVTVEKGKDKLFTITPDSDYHIADVLVDSVSVGAMSSYTFANVAGNHTISATFAIDTYTITANADPGGSINPSGVVTVNKGSNKLFVITPTVFYSIADVLVDGTTSLGAVASYTFTNVTADHTISATFNLLGSVYNQDKGTHYNTIQEAITDASNPSGDTILVMAGTYSERLVIGKPLHLIGASNNESVINLTGLGTPSPNILIEISSGVSDVSVTGFTLVGSPTFHYADESVMRFNGNNDRITISNNVINGVYGIIYSNLGGGDTLTVSNNIFVVNKNGIAINSARTNVVISDNTIEPGTSMIADPSGIYATDCDTLQITGNTITNMIGSDDKGEGIMVPRGSNIVISGNIITGNSVWGIGWWGSSATSYTITNNTISDNGHTAPEGETRNDGINIGAGTDININNNNIFGNAGEGIDSLVAVDATNNWWGDASGAYHPTTNPFGLGDKVSDNVIYIPWSPSQN